jgi:tetratricopeptide (TPR) repeat protein
VSHDQPDDADVAADALHVAGVAAARDGRFADSRTLLRHALDLGGGWQKPAARGLIQRNLTEVARRLGRVDEAVAAGRAAVLLLGHDAVALGNLGVALADQGDEGAALGCFDAALAIDPDLAYAHLGRAEILLRQGDFERGWAAYAWRSRVPGQAPLVPEDVAMRMRVWDGVASVEPLLVVADQGFGDMIQFARLLPWAASQCGRLVVHAPAAISPVLAGIAGVAEVIGNWAGLAGMQAWCALSDLPRLAGGGWAEEAAAVPYVSVTNEPRARWRIVLDAAVPPVVGRRRVGLVWAGRAEQSNDFARSMTLDRLAGLADVADVDWVSLQKGEAAAQIGDWPGKIADLAEALADFGDTAALLSLLDLTISVDTSVAHLAGAMGLKVWVMLRHRPDWRWDWYPTARPFRQPRIGDWDGVVTEVCRDVQGRSRLF